MSVGGPKIDVMIESISLAVYTCTSGVDSSPELRVVINTVCLRAEEKLVYWDCPTL